MGALELETILLPEDITNQVSLYCLACRQRLGAVSYVDRTMPDGSSQIAVSVSLRSDSLRDFRHANECVILICSCGQKSTFHLL